MKIKNIYSVSILLLGVIIVGCSHDFGDDLLSEGEAFTEGSVITLTTTTSDGTIKLSLDALVEARNDVWIDLNGDGIRDKDAIEDVKVFNVYQKYTLPADKNSVKVYGDITYLAAVSNNLIGIDITKNQTLTTLNLSQNNLSSVDLSSNPALKVLDLSGNQLVSINLSVNSALETLWVFNNRLKELNVTSNKELTFLDCSGNELTGLDLSNNNQLVRLLCFNNRITSIAIPQNNRLERFWSFGNPLNGDEIQKINSKLNRNIAEDFWISDEE